MKQHHTEGSHNGGGFEYDENKSRFSVTGVWIVILLAIGRLEGNAIDCLDLPIFGLVLLFTER